MRVAPRRLAADTGPLTRVPKPDTVKLEKIDPFFFPKNRRVLERLRKICLRLPETSEAESFGMPTFRVGKKAFCHFSCPGGAGSGLFWVGVEVQGTLTSDARFEVPAYMGHNGWIRLRLDKTFDAAEVGALVLESYRHFALKRMLKALDGA